MRSKINHLQNQIMKIFKPAFALLLIFTLLLGSTSCIVFHPIDNGGHKGWYKNRNNPHNPNTTNPGHTGNPGKSKGKGKK